MKTIIIHIIKGYRLFLSPVLPNSCRFYPTCSDYTIMAVKRYGVLRGLIKGFFRILRCNPFSKGGIDYP